MTEILRTPDERFEGLQDFPYAPHYVDELPGLPSLRIHYVDEGDHDADVTLLCLHGHPSWSHLYRRVIPVWVAAGCRVVAPDLPGFGRSDKPVDEAAFSFDVLRGCAHGLVTHLSLQNIVLVMHDWGGTIGLTLPMDDPARYVGLLIMNCWLATGDRPLPDGVIGWRS